MDATRARLSCANIASPDSSWAANVLTTNNLRVKQLARPQAKPNTGVTKQSGNIGAIAFIRWQGIRVMWHIINAIYEEYCQARLDEMLKLDVVK
jgi:hypothetical protein